MPPINVSSTNTRANVLLANWPVIAAGRTTTVSISSSKYHLLTNSSYAGRSRSRTTAAVPGRCTHTR